jgi:hypothetical protein
MMFLGDATGILPLSPCGRGWIALSAAKREPGEGAVPFSASPPPHPPSLGFASTRAPSPTRGEGKRARGAFFLNGDAA